MGMRLRAADFANAIHRLIVCPTAYGFIRAIAWHEGKNFVTTRSFPAEAALKTTTPDISHEEMYRPMFERVSEWLYQLRWVQHGKVQLYVLYIAVTLVVLLIWELR